MKHTPNTVQGLKLAAAIRPFAKRIKVGVSIVAGAIVGLSSIAYGTNEPPAWLPQYYLPDTPVTLGNPGVISITAYGNNKTQLTAPVTIDDLGTVGWLDFTYNTWSGNSLPAPGVPELGGALEGGYFNTTLQLQPGWQYGFVQIVSSTFSGTKNVWNAPNGSWYPDTKNQTDPDYPYEYLSGGVNPPVAPTKAFQDFPNRDPSNGDQYWNAQLALVVKNLGTHECVVIGEFNWGFSVTGDNPGPAGVTPVAPYGLGPPTVNFMNVLGNSFNSTITPGSTTWSISYNIFDAIIPEPAAFTLLGWALLLIAGAVYLRRQKAKT